MDSKRTRHRVFPVERVAGKLKPLYCFLPPTTKTNVHVNRHYPSNAVVATGRAIARFRSAPLPRPGVVCTEYRPNVPLSPPKGYANYFCLTLELSALLKLRPAQIIREGEIAARPTSEIRGEASEAARRGEAAENPEYPRSLSLGDEDRLSGGAERASAAGRELGVR